MTGLWLVFILGSLAAVFLAFIWVLISLQRLQAGGGTGKKSVEDLNKAYTDIAEEDATHLFNKEFREELRNRGRLRFEKIIDENAMFLKQDLDMTIAQLNDYMKQQISAKLDQEFAEYAKAMQQAQELALASLQRTAQEVEAQRVQLADALQKDVTAREAALLKVYEDNMAKIVEHYVLQALGDQFDLKSQLPYIIKQVEANKQNIIEDMRL
ncbi:MAG TPA: hypothetical protein VLG92_02320 [Candidatus Saccharimonadia bacterium]|nr:hypothetical protein [Candidatus Saccharimonadia bacterium]